MGAGAFRNVHYGESRRARLDHNVPVTHDIRSSLERYLVALFCGAGRNRRHDVQFDRKTERDDHLRLGRERTRPAQHNPYKQRENENRPRRLHSFSTTFPNCSDAATRCAAATT